MPELSRFYGIVIKMFYEDHPPPYFHAYYGGHEALIHVETLAVLAGELPPRAMGLVTEWASQHREKLSEAWDKARRFEPLGKIPPLD